ncbi:hypothetical protein SAMN02910447_03331 [Ruminococcus sp. YE71]|uniref:hypothetical protein n=1 Tax=unclassified Ruminococcus TaxID=2608920 RepID=UPI00088F3969|nr:MULTISPECIES: hypothetical protein [unclassified Ruminococcus]SDA31084.1 hypothetical protein SAMN02910446_03400 [Ruminococcus sp. YE78]SFW51011.1 hypothetical protein SAMN02910447_03331 [Ruminococcus sp. YE71]
MYKGKSKKLLTAALIISALTATACGNSADDSEATSSKEETKATTAESVQSADVSSISISESVADETSTVPDTDTSTDESSDASEPTYSEFDSISPEPSTVKISSDWTDLEFVLNNEVYTLGETTLKDLYDRGWSDCLGWGYDDLVESYGTAQSLEYFEFIREEGSIHINIQPKDNKSVLTALELDNTRFLYKKMLSTNDEYGTVYIIGLTTPGKITFGSSKEEVIDVFGQPDELEEVITDSAEKWLNDFNSRPATSSIYYENKSKTEEPSVDHRNYTEEDFRTEKLTYYSDNKEISFEISNLVGVCKITIRQDKNESFGDN